MIEIYVGLWRASIQLRMESSRGHNGIQLLMAAEQEAQNIVNAARSGMRDALVSWCPLHKMYCFFEHFYKIKKKLI